MKLNIAEARQKMTDNKLGYMTTKSGRLFCIHNPISRDMKLEDIAHALGLLCRFNGQINTFYSVAQHSVLVSQLVPERYAMYALMHDAPEAFIGDVITPLKRIIGCVYTEIEEKFLKAIAMKFHFSMSNIATREVKKADMIMLRTEMRDLSNFDFLDGERLPYIIKPLSSSAATELFLKRYEEINGGKAK